MPDFGRSETEIIASACMDRTVSLLMKVTDWENYNDNDIRVLTFRDDDTDADAVPLETIPWNPAEEDNDSSEFSYYDTVGERLSWTFADAMQLMEVLPEGTSLIPGASRSSFLRTMMIYCGSGFINTGTARCNFQSRNFLDMIEYAKSLPEELDADSHGEDYRRNYESQYREGRTILAGISISSFSDINYYVNGLFGEEASYVGFPMEDGSGSYIRAGESYAISAHSACAEGAWEFLRYYLTDEYQSGIDIYLKSPISWMRKWAASFPGTRQRRKQQKSSSAEHRSMRTQT